MLIDLAKQVPIEIADHEFCKNGYDGWHDITLEWKKITKNSIKLCKWLDKKRLTQTAVHELWHQYYFTGLDDVQREEWKKLNSANKNVLDSKRLYSQKNEIEDFADSFQHSFSKDGAGMRSDLFKAKLKWINGTKTTAKEKFNLFDFSKVNK